MIKTSDDKLVIIICNNNEISMICTNTQTIKKKIQSKEGKLNGLQISSDNKFIICTTEKGKLLTYNLETWQLLEILLTRYSGLKKYLKIIQKTNSFIWNFF